jgi:hydrogenase maturation protein HypF
MWQAFEEDWRSQVPAAWIEALPPKSVTLVEQLLRAKSPSALTSSCGRLFDAVAALALSRTTVTYEAQAAIALEACCQSTAAGDPYPFAIAEGTCLQIQTAPLFTALCGDLLSGVPAAVMSRRFHDGLVKVLADVVLRISARSQIQNVCLSGGSFQNAHLLVGLTTALSDAGMVVATNKMTPPGDGGLSFGQLVVAAHRTRI